MKRETFYIYVCVKKPELPWVIRTVEGHTLRVASWVSQLPTAGHTGKTDIPCDVGRWTVEIRDAWLSVEDGKARFL